MIVHESALKHGVQEDDVLVAAHTPVYISEPDDDVPARQFALGFDRHGRLLELVILTFDSGNRMVIHAMKARRQYLHLLS